MGVRGKVRGQGKRKKNAEKSEKEGKERVENVEKNTLFKRTG